MLVTAVARRTRAHCAAAVILLCAGGSAAANDDAPVVAPPPPAVHELTSLTEICAMVKCRAEARDVRLVAADGGSFAFKTQGFPYTDPGGNVIIYPGEALEVAFDQADIAHPTFAGVVPNASVSAPGTLTLEFAQMAGQPYMTLMLNNATGVALRYDAMIYVPAREGMQVVRSSSCPVLSGMTNTESWPHPVVMVELSNFRVEPVGAGVSTVACN